MYALVVHDIDGRLIVYTFTTEKAADDYRDEFGGRWNDWALVEVSKPTY